MVRDRMADLVAKQESHEMDTIDVEIESDNEKFASMEKFMEEVKVIYEIINEIETDANVIKSKYNSLLISPYMNDALKQDIDILTTGIKSKANTVKNKLKAIDSDIKENDDGVINAKIRIKKMQNSQLSQRFVQVMTEYNKVQLDYKDRCKKNLQRQLQITGRNIDDEELDKMLDEGELSVFNQGIIMQTEQAKNSLREIEARHTELMKLEKSLKELNEMFLEMALLIKSQGEMVDNIQNIVEKTSDYIEGAREEVTRAREYQRKARRKRLILTICLVVFILILVISLYKFIF